MRYTPATATAAIILILFSLATFTSCITKKKVQKYLHNNPEFSANYCAEAFPIKTDSIYIPGEIKTDTLINEVERYIEVDCPPADTINKIQWKIKTEIRTIERLRVDTIKLGKEVTAKVRALELANLRIANENEMLRNDLKAMTGKRNKNMYWLWAVLALIAVRTYLKIRFKIKWL